MLIAESLCILVGTLPLVLGYSQTEYPAVAIGCLVVGLLWLFGRSRRWAWVASAGLLIDVVAAATGIWFGLNPLLVTVSLLGSLFAWDLADFSRRLSYAAPDDNLRSLKKNHFIRLAALGTLALALDLLAIFTHLHITFGWVFLLVLAAVLGLVQLVKRLRESAG